MKLRRMRHEAYIPLNAMSDVAFLLLIFIMLVSLINYRKEVKVDYPEAQSAEKVSVEKNTEIWIDSSGALYLDGNLCDISVISDKVDDLYRNAPDTRIHIISDRNTNFEYVNEVITLLQQLEYRGVSFVTK